MCLNEVRRQGGTPCLWPLWRGPYLSRQKPKGENWMVSGRRRLHKAPPLAVRGLGFKLKRVLRLLQATSHCGAKRPTWITASSLSFSARAGFGCGGSRGCGGLYQATSQPGAKMPTWFTASSLPPGQGGLVASGGFIRPLAGR